MHGKRARVPVCKRPEGYEQGETGWFPPVTPLPAEFNTVSTYQGFHFSVLGFLCVGGGGWLGFGVELVHCARQVVCEDQRRNIECLRERLVEQRAFLGARRMQHVVGHLAAIARVSDADP